MLQTSKVRLSKSDEVKSQEPWQNWVQTYMFHTLEIGEISLQSDGRGVTGEHSDLSD
jgi:hypothetical protein